jgi:transcriptional regulator GlxA family with amidase domain
MTSTTTSTPAPRPFLADHHPERTGPEAAVARAYHEIGRRAPERSRSKGLADWQVKKVIRHIDQNIRMNLKIVDLGALVHLSASHFSRSFKVSFGEPPYAYVLSRRVAVAMDLIHRTDEPLSQIASECGMCDQAHMCKSFRRLAGMTPQEWRRKSRGSAALELRQKGRIGAAAQVFALKSVDSACACR